MYVYDCYIFMKTWHFNHYKMLLFIPNSNFCFTDFILSDISIAAMAFLWMLFAWCMFTSFYFNPHVSFNLKCLLMQRMDWSHFYPALPFQFLLYSIILSHLVLLFLQLDLCIPFYFYFLNESCLFCFLFLLCNYMLNWEDILYYNILISLVIFHYIILNYFFSGCSGAYRIILNLSKFT